MSGLVSFATPWVSGYSPAITFPPGTIASGFIGPYTIGSGSVFCGHWAHLSEPVSKCQVCGHGFGWLEMQIRMNPGSFCEKCAGWRQDLGRFENRLDWIKESVPLSPETPLYALADYLEEWSRDKDAQYVRNLMLTSGG